MDVVINYWAVLLSVIVAAVLGFIWYGPLFGKQWMHMAGITKAEMEEGKKKGMAGMWKSMVPMLIASFLMAFVLAHELYYMSAYTRMVGIDNGITGALWLWLGFIAPVTLSPVLWEKKPWKYWFITSGYYLVLLVLMGVILSLWV